MGTGLLQAQNTPFGGKISPELQEVMEENKATNEMFRVVIVMNYQFDASKNAAVTKHLSKGQQREFVTNALQQLSEQGQKALLKELGDGQKARLVDDIRSFWIFNGICCSATKEMIIAIAERPDVKYVTTDMEIRIPDGEDDTAPLPEDAERATNEWNVTKVNADAVWNLGYTGKGIIVAVIDTGVNYNHTDIADNMWDGGEAFPNHGWDFINNDNDPIDDNGHGSHCAGTVSSSGTNGKQCGIAKDAKIMALKTLNSGGGGSSAYSWSAIEFAITHGADVLSMSLGSKGTGGSWAYRTIMENVLQCGVVAAVSAGNVGDDLSTYPIPMNVGSPGNCPSPWQHPDQTLAGGHSAVITVGSTTNADTHSSFSSYGPSTWATGNSIGFYADYPWEQDDPNNIGLIKPDISAPGSSIVSLSHSSNTGYTTKSGTSMAAPCVAGVIALMLEANPTLSPVEIDSIIETTAVACGGQVTKNNTFGAGRIDALAAINYMQNVCATPTNLTASVNQATVDLNWTAAANVETYRVYRDGEMIASSVAATTYSDVNAPSGTHTYFVRSNGSNHQASLPSNQVTVTLTTNVGISSPNLLILTSFNDENVNLSWTECEPREATLAYTNTITNYTGTGEELIAAQRFPAALLQQYAGMQIERVYFSVYNSGVECGIDLYEGDEMRPGTLLHHGSIMTAEDQQMVDYALEVPIAINPNKSLWMTVSSSDYFAYSNDYEAQNENDAFMFGYPDSDYWIANHGLAWSFQIALSDNLTYNVYRNDQIVSSQQSETAYSGTFTEGVNEYHITTNTNGFESANSNRIIIVKGDAAQAETTLAENDRLIILPNSKLTVSGTVSNSNAENLVLENGAQLVHNNEGVKATVKKAITPYTENMNDGWHFIASPVTDAITPATDNGLLSNDYDLYLFDQNETLEWRNYRKNAFLLNHKSGYLYANSANTTLTFAGTLAATTDATPLAYNTEAKFAGFNLVGNPFACNATVSKDYYIIDGNTVALAGNNHVVAPCEAVMVQASENNQSVTFSKAQTRGNSTANSFDIVLTQDRADLDRARVRLSGDETLEKFSLNGDNGSKIYIPQDSKDYAVARAEGLNELPLNFKATKNGTYTLSFELGNAEMEYLHLIDNMTGTDVDLLASVIARNEAIQEPASYTFDARTTDYPSRFRLMFASTGSATDTASTDETTFAYLSNGELIVNGEGTLQVIDILGRQHYAKELSTDNCQLPTANCQLTTANFPAGVYVLRLISGDEVKTQKIVIE